MRLWPLSILQQLPRQQLLGQHRECCALRGRGWGRKHATVDYVFRHPYKWLYLYHRYVLAEMDYRKYRPEKEWWLCAYRGKLLGFDASKFTRCCPSKLPCDLVSIYPEHDEAYLRECIENLARKGVVIKPKSERAKTYGQKE